jgi:photosystem II stability/assembly factor-like uncharacterized protein
MDRVRVLLGVLAGLLLVGFALLPAAHAQSSDDVASWGELGGFDDLDFRQVGPSRGGRVTAVEGHPAHPHTFYMGGAGGSGVWKTTDHGTTWTNLSDGHGFRSTSIGAIEVADSDTSVVYVGTGTDGIRSNVTTGRGIYKSTDAGESWSFLGLEDAGQIGAVEVHPQNPDRAYVAALGHPFKTNAQRGVFRTTDGGDTWEKVLYQSDSTGAVDLELHPENPDVIYAAMWRGERKPWTIISGAREEDGLYKSTDGGDTWTEMTNGLPQGLVGKADFAVTPAAPDRVYALVEAPGDQQGLYRSDDRGETWTQVSDKTEIMSRPFYFTNIDAHPQDPDKIFVGNVYYWVSSDGGETFSRKEVTHVDVHDLWINPENPDLRVQGNDGGATVSLDGGTTWSTQLNQPTAELYQVNVDDRFPYWLYAGQQDNSTIMVPSLPPAESAPSGPEGWWKSAGGCETGPIVPRPDDPTVVYANCKGRFGRYSHRTGQQRGHYVGGQYIYGRNPAKLTYRFQRVVPIEVSPHDNNTVYHGSQFVHKTTDGGKTWTTISPDLTANKPEYQVASGRPINRDITGEEHYSTLYSIRVSHHDADVIWAGANDGPVHVTQDGGMSWTDVTPDALPENARIDAIEPSPHAAGTVKIAAHRRLVGDFTPYVFRTTDHGQTWTRLTTGGNGIPSDYPVRVVREDPDREGLLYAGTDFGLFVSFDAGGHWQPLQQDLPVTPITDIRVHEQDLVLSTMGRGFWILDTLTPLHQLSDAVASSDSHLFDPADAYRMSYRGGQRGAGGPEFPDPGATIDYYFAEQPTQPVTLDIVNAGGTVIRSFEATPVSEDETGDETPMMDAPDQPEMEGDLPAEAGHNRFTWDLRHPGPAPDATEDQPYFGAGFGPLAAPGMYQVRLSVGNRQQTRPLRVRIDPRVDADGLDAADLQAQTQFNLRLRDLIGQARKTLATIDSLREETEDDARMEVLNELRGRLATPSDMSYPPPMLIDQMEYLYFMTNSADQEISEDAKTRFQTLRSRLSEIRSALQP